MMDEEAIQQISNLFNNFLNPNEEIRKPAEELIKNMLIENRFTLLDTCFKLLNMHHILITPSVQKRALVFLDMCFSPILNYTHDQLSNNWLNIKRENKELYNNIKNICINLMLNPDLEIRELTAQLLAKIYLYDRGNFYDVFGKLVEILKNQYPPNMISINTEFCKISSLRAMKFVFENTKYKMERFNFSGKFKRSFQELLALCIKTFLPNYNNYKPDFIEEVYNTLALLVQIETELLDQIEIIMKLTFDVVRDCNEKVYRAIYNFLYSLILTFYENEIPGIENLAISVLKLTLDTTTNNNNAQLTYEKLCILIDFWNQIARYEREIRQSLDCISKYEEIMISRRLPPELKCLESKRNYFGIIENVSNQLLPFLLQSMICFNKEDIFLSDNLNIHEHYMYATSCVRKIFYLNPQICFQNIISFFEPNLRNSSDWCIRNAQMLMIWCICDYNFYSPIRDFLFFPEFSDWLLGSMKEFFSIPRLIDTTLATISAIFKTYKLFLPVEKCIILLEIINNICQNTEEQELVNRCLEVLISFVTLFDRNEENYAFSKILDYIMGILSNVYKRSDFINESRDNDVRYYQTFYDLKIAIIQHVYSQNSEFVSSFTAQSYENFISSSSIIVLIGEINVLSQIMQLYGQHFQELGLNVIMRLISLINSTNLFLADECLKGVILIAGFLENNVNQILPELTEQINNVYNSQNPGLIIKVNRIIGILFSKMGMVMKDLLFLCVDSIISIITEMKTNDILMLSNQIYDIIYPLSQIIQSIPPDFPICSDAINKIFPILISLLQYTPFRNENNNEENNDHEIKKCELLEAILEGLAAIIKKSDKQFLKKNKYLLFKVTSNLKALKFRTNNLLYSYCDFIDAAYIKMHNDPQFILKLYSRENQRMLIYGMCSSDFNLYKRSKELFEKLQK